MALAYVKGGASNNEKLNYINIYFSVYDIIRIHVNLNPWDQDVFNNHY